MKAMARFKNQFSAGRQEEEKPNTYTCYPEGPGWSDGMSTHTEPSRNGGFGGKALVSEAAVPAAPDREGLFGKLAGAQERLD